MPLLQELGTLVEGWGFGSITSTSGAASIQLGRRVGQPNDIVALIPYQGRQPVRHMGIGSASVVYQQPNVQVYVRRVDAAAAEAVAYDLHNRFDFFEGTVLGVRYFLIECLQPPFTIGVDENMRTQYVFNINIRREPAP